MKKTISILGIITMLLFTTVSVNAVFVPYDTLPFGGKADITGKYLPVFSNPNPANGTTGVSISLSIWNITIEDPEGDTFNWSIDTSPDVGNDSGTGSSNGSKNTTLSSLQYSTTYTVYVNATDIGSGEWTNETLWFETEADVIFTPYATLSFGGKVEVQSEYPQISDEYPANNSIDKELQPTFSVTVEDIQGIFNITWLHNKTGAWVVFGYNSSCIDGIYTQNGTWANETETEYNWSVHVNDTEGHWTNETYNFTTAGYSWGNWSGWWTFGHTTIYDIAMPLDMKVTYLDASDFTSHYLETGDPGWINADIDDSGIVNYIDASALTAHYGEEYG